ncbi:MAG: hypothetical protein WCK05_12620 [Planctomycetota bacterium]
MPPGSPMGSPRVARNAAQPGGAYCEHWEHDGRSCAHRLHDADNRAAGSCAATAAHAT